MPKINQEEYEVLKELDDEWKWIARNYNGALITYTDKPMKNPNLYWDSFGERMDDRLFQFIQWEDEEPHNIQKLIEEYEYSALERHVNSFKELSKAIRTKESEETVVKKDIEWLKEEIEEDIKSWGGGNPDYFRGASDAYENVKDWLNQLDEPEVLSQEWIDEHKKRKFFDFDEYRTEVILVEDLQNLLVPKQELPVVPTWFDEWWKYATKGGGNLFHNMERFYDELFSSGTRETYEYISNPDNKKKLLNIIINELEYEVEEEEQKYIVSDNSSIPLLIKDDSGKVMSYDSQIAYNNSNGTIELTEQEIKGYDPRYMAFAKPVEELEK